MKNLTDWVDEKDIFNKDFVCQDKWKLFTV